MKAFISLIALSVSVGASTILQAQQRTVVISSPSQSPIDYSPGKPALKVHSVDARLRPSIAMAATGVTACSMVTDGSFEAQVAVPVTISQVARAAIAGNGSYTNGILPFWVSPNPNTTDYFATNAPSGSLASPGCTDEGGAFTPHNFNSSINNGTIGIFAYATYYSAEYNVSGIYTEMISQKLAQPLVGGKKYYASFWAHLAPNAKIATSLGLNVTAIDPYDASRPPSQLRTYAPSSSGINSLQPLTIRNWTQVKGSFIAEPNAQFLNLGYLFSPGNSNTLAVSGAGTPTSDGGLNAFTYIPSSYYYIDDVELYAVPTAGPNKTISCAGGEIGDGCDIPGASYAWTINGGNILSNTLITTVAPSSTTVYTLTVTLPDGSTHVTSTTVTPGPLQTPGKIEGHADYAAGRLTGQIDPVPRATSYNWYRGSVLNTVSHGEAAIWLLPRNGCGGVTISVQAVFACGNSAKISQYCPTENGGCGRVQSLAYPNPTTEFLTVPKGAEAVTLLDNQGKPVSINIISDKIYTQNLPNGNYTLRVILQGITSTQHIMVQH